MDGLINVASPRPAENIYALWAPFLWTILRQQASIIILHTEDAKEFLLENMFTVVELVCVYRYLIGFLCSFVREENMQSSAQQANAPPKL